MDKILVSDLCVRGLIGIEPAEREQPQNIIINITAYASTRPAALSDDITAAVNYAEMAEQVRRHVEAGHPLLVERLAEEIAGILLTQFPVNKVRVRVEKPDALPHARAVGVEIVRRRKKGGSFLTSSPQM